MPFEREFQEQLANDPGLLESGLRRIDAEGTRGGIDVVARDAAGSWVVIVLRRADTTVRQALRELTRRTELLRREKGLAPARVRAVIASTSWDELLVPVSNLARDWSHDLRGYQLVPGPDGVLARAERVELLPAPAAAEVTPVRFTLFFGTEAERDAGWRQVVGRATEVGARDLLAADLRRVRDVERVRAPLGLHVAIGRMDPALAPAGTRAAAAESDDAPPGYELEHEARRHIGRHVSWPGRDDDGPGVPRRLGEDPRWTIESYRTTGGFAERSPLTTHDLLRELNGDHHGTGRIRYTGSARTTDRAGWPVFLTEHRKSLDHNADWAALVRLWLDDVGAAPTESDVLLHVYNPCDLVTTLVRGWPDDLDRFTPMLLGIARTAAGPHRIIRGTLYWNGRPVPDLAERVRSVYRDPAAWLADADGDNRSRDAVLVASLELRYVFFEHVSHSVTTIGEDDDVTLWAVKDGSPARFATPFTGLRQEGWSGMYALPTFLDEHRGQIDALVSAYRNTLPGH